MTRQSTTAREKASRRSSALRRHEAQNIVAAAYFAAQHGVALNRHTTIHFDVAGITNYVVAIGRLMKLAGDWLRTEGYQFAYVWVRESGENKGEHVHILWHVPPQLASSFARREIGWRKRIGATRKLGAFRSRPVGHSYRHAQQGLQYGKLYGDHLTTVVGYLLKGSDRQAVDDLGLTRIENGGELLGKRCGTSENIGLRARMLA